MEKEKLRVEPKDKYALTIAEATAYFGIGENTLRAMIKENPTSKCLLWVGNHVLIKRKNMENQLDESIQCKL